MKSGERGEGGVGAEDRRGFRLRLASAERRGLSAVRLAGGGEAERAKDVLGLGGGPAELFAGLVGKAALARQGFVGAQEFVETLEGVHGRGPRSGDA